MDKKLILAFALICSLLTISYSQKSGHSANIQMKSKWITHPSANLNAFGVYLFRKTFNLAEKPDSFIVHVSADNRYRLFVNGLPVCYGPARGDVKHWRYETLDIGSKLQVGKNVIAAQVFNEGADKPIAQITAKTAFFMEGNTSIEDIVNTGDSSHWKVIINEGSKQLTNNDLKWWNWANGWYAIGGTDKIDGSKYLWSWEKMDFNDSSWLSPKVLGDSESPWVLEPRPIPLMEEKMERFAFIRRTSNITATTGFINGIDSLPIPPNETVSLLLDMSYLTIGYPELIVSRGKGSSIKITYAEALFDNANKKGNRDDIQNKSIKGYWDIFMPDGGINRTFRPLWFRTFRYVQLNITTAGDTLFLKDYHHIFTAYPFQQKASFACNDSSLGKIWDVSWHTARNCAVETYFDCPYYEQLNYEGDTRIQAYISLFISGDDRLMRDAINQFNNSTQPDGLTQGAYPWDSGQPFYITTYSLYFINMVHDYYMHNPDTSFISNFFPTIRSVLKWFYNYKGNNGLIRSSGRWNFVDWSFGNGPYGAEENDSTGYSSIVSLIYLKAIQDATELFKAFGFNDEGATWQGRADDLSAAIYANCYDSNKGLFTDAPSVSIYSQHANLLAVLTNTISLDKQKSLMQKVLSDPDLTQCTVYFKFYLFQSMKKAGLSEQFFDKLGEWKEMIRYGLTTFDETGQIDGVRSDCHAWSASPIYFLMSLVCGIEPAEPGFGSVKISPILGPLDHVRCSMPHPKGVIEVDLSKNAAIGITGKINLPAGLEGVFVWNDTTINLKNGSSDIDILNPVGSSAKPTIPVTINVYPTLVHDNLKVDVFPGQVFYLKIYDISGKNRISKKLKSIKNTVDFTALKPGTYLYRIYDAKGEMKNGYLIHK